MIVSKLEQPALYNNSNNASTDELCNFPNNDIHSLNVSPCLNKSNAIRECDVKMLNDFDRNVIFIVKFPYVYE